MLEFLLDILMSFMVLGITLFSAHIIKFKNSTLENIVAITGLFGIFLVGTGMYIGGSVSVHAYHYIIFIVQLIITGLLLLLYRLFKRGGPSKLINICSIFLVLVSLLTYVYYIIASFIYY